MLLSTYPVLGSAIIVEIVMMLLLGGVLLFFICKCVNALHREGSDATIKDKEDPINQTVSVLQSTVLV